MKNRFPFPSVCAILWLIVQGHMAQAASYYIASNGNDSNAGTSADAPWRSVTNVYRFQWSIKPGDSVLLRAGDSFDGPLSLGNGGTAQQPITISRYGTGADPIIYGNHPSAVWTPVTDRPGVYSTTLGAQGLIDIGKVYDADGNKYWHLPQGTNDLGAWLNTFTNKCWGETPARNTIYVRTSDDKPPVGLHVMESSPVSIGGGYHIVQNLEICNGGKGIVASGKGDIIRNNYIHDGYGTGVFLYYGSSAEISSNTVARTAYTQIYLLGGGKNWIHHNTCTTSGGAPYATGGTYIINGKILAPNAENCGIGLQQGTNNLVEYNSLSNYPVGDFIDWFYEVDSEARYNYGFRASMATAPVGTGLKVHHNVFNLNGIGSGISAMHGYDAAYSPLPDSGPVLIYNNVIHDFIDGGFYSRGTAPGLVFRNNILTMLILNKAFVNITTPVSSDYNVFFCKTGSALGWVLNDNKLSSTLANWRTASGNDTHSIYADPGYVSDQPVSAADFQLKANSPCIGAGVDLRTVGLIGSGLEFKDFSGVLVPAGTVPSIGAYQGNAALPPTPTGVRVVP